MTHETLGAGYARLWTAAVVSRLGDALRNPTLALLAAAFTRDPRAIAAVVVAGQLPPLLFGLVGGVYADRWDRRRTMAGVDGLRAVLVGALAVLVATDRAGIATLAAAAFALATLGTLFDSAAFAVLPALVPPGRLAGANGRLQAGTTLAGGILGAPLAGVLFAFTAALPFAVDAVSFAVAALLALTLPAAASGTAAAAPGDGTGGSERRPVRREAADGVRVIRRDPTLLLVTALASVTNLAISGLISIIVLYALDVLGVPERGYGLFMAASVLGGLAGAVSAGRLVRRTGTVGGLRLVLAGQTLALVALALARHPVVGGVALAVFSAGTAVWNSLWTAYGQKSVPAGLLGRVGSAQRTAALLTAPIGALAAGFVAERYGVLPVAWAAAAVFAAATAGSWRALRNRPEPAVAAQPSPASRASAS